MAQVCIMATVRAAAAAAAAAAACVRSCSFTVGWGCRWGSVHRAPRYRAFAFSACSRLFNSPQKKRNLARGTAPYILIVTAAEPGDCVCDCVISGCLSVPCRVQCNFVLGYDGVLHWSASIERKSDAELIQDAKFSVSKWISSGINNKGCCVGTFQGNMEDQNAWDLASIGPSGACFTFIIRPSTSDLYVQATRAVCLPRQLHTVDINHGGRGGSLSLLSG
jgi:hypothetical protein